MRKNKYEEDIEGWKAAWESVVAYGKAAQAAKLSSSEKKKIENYVRKQAHRFSALIRKAHKAILKQDNTPYFPIFEEPDDDEDDFDE
jgi:hypothetical protein